MGTGIISDTLYGAIVLSVFDFFACFIVLWFIGFFIEGFKLLHRIKNDFYLK